MRTRREPPSSRAGLVSIKSRLLVKAPRDISPISTRRVECTDGSLHDQGCLAIYLEFLRFYPSHDGRAIAATGDRTELPVPVERFKLRPSGISTPLQTSLQTAILGVFVPNKIPSRSTSSYLLNGIEISETETIENILRVDTGSVQAQGHLITILLVYNVPFLLNLRYFDIRRYSLVPTNILFSLWILFRA